MGVPWRSEWMGNPAKYAVWADESFNLEIRRLAEGLHASTLERRMLAQLNAPPLQARKKRRT